MTSKITEFHRPHYFVDEMQRGPFAFFRHEHGFDQDGAITTMVDSVDYRLPLGPLGAVADAVFVGDYLRRLLEKRNRHIKAIVETSPS
jgi:ligand-binding SRPBCC domain-containing protein